MGIIFKDRHGKVDMPQEKREDIAALMTFRQLRLVELATRVEVDGDVITFYGKVPGSKIRQRLCPPDPIKKVVGHPSTKETLAFAHELESEWSELIKKALA